MATPHYFGIAYGPFDEHSVTEGTSTTGKTVEVAVDLDSGIKKGELYIALTAIRDSLSRMTLPND